MKGSPRTLHLTSILLAVTVCSCGPAARTDSLEIRFDTLQLSDTFYAEGANFADLNRDGHPDVVSGPYWYEGPDFTRRHEYYPPQAYDPEKYSEHFLTFIHDVNGNGWVDVIAVGFPGAETWWYENPGGDFSGHWRRHLLLAETGGESPAFEDLTGDGVPELVCVSNEGWGYARPDPTDPYLPWIFHPISPPRELGRFTHGLGLGDVNGNRRKDLVEANGWWEQPESLEGDPLWTFHPHDFGQGGAQMFVFDVDGDGLPDVVTSLEAHGYGLAWFQQVLEDDGSRSFRKHLIVGETPEDTPHGVVFSQIHALASADMDGDGLPDVVTGKRFWAHGSTGDPEPNAPAVLYWFRLLRHPDGTAEFIPHLIHDDSGVGTQVVVGDISGNGRLNVLVGNKKGTFLHLQREPGNGR